MWWCDERIPSFAALSYIIYLLISLFMLNGNLILFFLFVWIPWLKSNTLSHLTINTVLIKMFDNYREKLLKKTAFCRLWRCSDRGKCWIEIIFIWADSKRFLSKVINNIQHQSFRFFFKSISSVITNFFIIKIENWSNLTNFYNWAEWLIW